MTEIEITVGRKNTVKIKGHASYAPRGQDIVCAAVSAIFQTLCMAVGEVYEKKGDVCGVEFKGRRTELKMACLGFAAIEGVYPENVRVSIKGYKKSLF